MPLEFQANFKIENGKLFLRNRRLFDEVVSAWPDCEGVMTIEKKHATRSVQANRYWWGVCVALVAEHTGYTPEQIHDLAKQMFLPKHLAVTGKNGELLGEYVVGGTTTTLNKLEFGEFVNKFKEWALDKLDVLIPEADPDYAEKRDTHAA
jgi:hypothetical protein